MDRLEAMRVFLDVAELQSFTRAADRLNLPKATVTIAIQELEAAIGVKLLNRTTRTVNLTTDGSVFLERCKDILTDVDEATSMFTSKGAEIKGKIRLDMALPMARDFFVPALPSFLREHPEVEIELVGADRKLDLIREGIDCAIRGSNRLEPGLAERVIGSMPVVNIASPAYIKQYGKPKNLDDLRKHKLIQYVQTFGGTPEGFEYFDGEKAHEVKMRGVITVTNIDTYKAACVAGLGICQNPLLGVRASLQSGELVEILPKFRAEPMKLALVFPQRRLMTKRVRVFLDWLEPRLRTHLEKNSKL